ncbi:hypothetical protein ILYODFUR_023950 [Ilyodon furcidens]|uniref:Uncharacterized protein n=1 Tax=Ilyodon furcidens TaxID=33524 RepID=A0ABV0SZN8_9TELE
MAGEECWPTEGMKSQLFRVSGMCVCVCVFYTKELRHDCGSASLCIAQMDQKVEAGAFWWNRPRTWRGLSDFFFTYIFKPLLIKYFIAVFSVSACFCSALNSVDLFAHMLHV